MYIKNLALMNYRNYESAKITFSEGINILYGDNAQGKTNILEAIFVAVQPRVIVEAKTVRLSGLGKMKDISVQTSGRMI